MEEIDENITPFWLQTTDNPRNHRRRSRQPSSSLFFNTGVLIFFLLVIAFAFVFFIIPSFLSFTSKIFKPQLVKKSWDSVNLVLVIFAIICGFLSKTAGNGENGTPRAAYEVVRRSSSNPSTPRQWYDYPSSIDRAAANNSLRRLRSISSYPDLRREEDSWRMNSDDHWRFYDDTHLYSYRSRSRREYDREQLLYTTKDIAVDTVQVSPPPPQTPSPPPVAAPPQAEAAATASPPRPPQSPPPQPPKAVRRKPKRTYEDVKPKEKSERKEVIYSELKSKHSLPLPPPSTPPPTPPPPPPPLIAGSEKRSDKSEKKRGTTVFLNSLRRKKKQRQRQRSVENLDEFFNLATLPLYPPPSPPPPPPPPPPPLPSFYKNIFSSKKSRVRKNHSIPPPPPPPLPQPALEARATKREARKPPVTTQKPDLPVKVISSINKSDESIESGNESPLNRIPPPPPPPPFKILPWKFEVRGDYVRLKSINSSRSGSPDLDDPLSDDQSEIDGVELTASPLFCPSPDVNTKAAKFIERFRAGLKMEKTESIRGRSNLGPNPGPNTV